MDMATLFFDAIGFGGHNQKNNQDTVLDHPCMIFFPPP